MNTKIIIAALSVITLGACQQTVTDKHLSSSDNQSNINTDDVNAINPASDPDNQGDWRLNTQMSDEFNGESIDEKKWFIQGKNQGFYLWKGRAPSQFAPHNAFLEDGHLKIRTQWQPDYPFVGKPPQKQEIKAYENITTAAVISQHTFLYGYMEVRVKIPDAAMTGAFWGTGYQQELDIFELIGQVKTGGRKPESTFVTSIHDWRPGHAKQNKVWKQAYDMPGRTADNFYTYGVEWLPDGLKMYFEGELIHHATQQALGDNWLLNNPMELWFDSEVFPWHGIPEKHELPVDYEIDYVRVWQQADNNLIDRAFFGFEGPLLMNVYHKPENKGLYSHSWWIDEKTSPYLSITDFNENKFSTGRKSLKLDLTTPSAQSEFIAFAPNSSINLPAGNYQINAKVWLSKDTDIKSLQFILETPWLEVKPISLTDQAKESWVEVTAHFTKKSASKENDRLRVLFKQASQGQVYLDDIKISKI